MPERENHENDITDAVDARTTLERERQAFHIIAEAAINTSSIPELCHQILSGLVEILGFDKGTVRLYEEKEQLLRIAAFVGIPAEKLSETVSLDDPKYVVARAARERLTLYISDTETHSLTQARLERVRDLKIGTVIFWPIIGADDSLLGVINVGSAAKKEIAGIDRRFFETVAGMFATVLEQREAEELLRESEERFNLFADHLPGPLYIKDHESRVLYVNRYMRSMTDGTDWVGTTNYHLFTPEVAARRTEEDQRVLTEGPLEIEVTRPMPDGTMRVFRTTKFPIHRKGKPPLLGGFSIDITALKETEKRLETTLSRLEFLNDLMAHDLSNMQQGVMASLELMMSNGTLPDELRALAEGALDQTKRGVMLIANVKKLSRIDMDERKLATMDPHPVLMNSIEIVKNSYPERMITITTNLEHGQYSVLADEFLVDVFYNLLHNSVRVDTNEEVLIDVVVAPSEEPGFLRLRFEDRGPGLSDTQKEVILSRIDDKVKRGTGIGLTIVKRIIDRYEGKVQVDDRVQGEPDLGVCFVISLHVPSE